MLGTIFNTNLMSIHFYFLVYPRKSFLEATDFKPKLAIKQAYLANTRTLLKGCKYKHAILENLIGVQSLAWMPAQP